jgi:type III restriction enzyme
LKGIEFSWCKGEHPKQGSFNPDFFIKVGNDIIVVEIKMDNDVSDENKAKLRYAREHFARVNESSGITSNSFPQGVMTCFSRH